MTCNNLSWFFNRFLSHSSSRIIIQKKKTEQEKIFQQFPRWLMMRVNSNISALPGLLPFISLTFRRSSGSCQAQFLSGTSCILLTAAECACGWKSPSAFGQLAWKGRCLCAQASACLGQWGIALQLVGCTSGAVKLK